MSGESREEFERDRFGTAGLVAKHPASDHEMLCEIWETSRKMKAALDEVCYRTATSSQEEQEAHDQKVRREVLEEAARLLSGPRTDDGTDRDEALCWAASRIRLFAETGK